MSHEKRTREESVRAALRVVAITACLPYLTLKAVWITGAKVGIPHGSSLLEHRTTMVIANSVTVLLDTAVIVLAFALTRPWGRRVPAWLLAVPMWVATGLLTPITAGYPLELVVHLFGGSTRTTSPGGRAFLEPWVFAMVYTGFIVQAACLTTLFALYARDRWGHLWRGRTGELPVAHGAAAQRAVAVAAALLALFPIVLHVLWACGAEPGLGAGLATDRTSDFYLLESLDLVYLVTAAAAGLLLAFRRAPRLPVAVPLTGAWVGSGVLTCWLSLPSLFSVADIADRPTQLMNCVYAVQMIVGMLVATVGLHQLVQRQEATAARDAGPVPSPARVG
ncbi:hypothetical protein [Streptomyces beihaiensis]|uniref:Aromatic ring-opening dioxygenase LigA n=1 Tax=Streptomyces beihaiensis TaxID=2984495 RepID=A0ABT3U4C7_9ACTN|nr:hypothetical protein [Streptomyces beihaiensis]MCX3064158.1 hypothetical protein [Streptomyces beihaiensis]